MLIEELFSRGVMIMGPSKADPSRQVGVFRPEAVSGLPAIRRSEMDKFRWLSGQWNFENRVPATRFSPAYTDIGVCRFAFCEKDAWICGIASDGVESRQITFDPFSRQWIYVLTQGSYGLLRSPEGWVADRIVFSGAMTMLGIDCQWRMTWTKTNDNVYNFTNEQLAPDKSWQYIDEWRFTRPRTHLPDP